MDRANRFWLFVRLNFIIRKLHSKYSCDINAVRLYGGPKTRGKRLGGDVKEKKGKRNRRMGREGNPRKLNERQRLRRRPESGDVHWPWCTVTSPIPSRSVNAHHTLGSTRQPVDETVEWKGCLRVNCQWSPCPKP